MTYGLVAGLLCFISKWKCLLALYRSLIIAMLVLGRTGLVPFHTKRGVQNEKAES